MCRLLYFCRCFGCDSVSSGTLPSSEPSTALCALCWCEFRSVGSACFSVTNWAWRPSCSAHPARVHLRFYLVRSFHFSGFLRESSCRWLTPSGISIITLLGAQSMIIPELRTSGPIVGKVRFGHLRTLDTTILPESAQTSTVKMESARVLIL